VIVSRIPGNVGMLGEDYPSCYPVGDKKALALLPERAEADTALYESLKAWSTAP
jgi:hypothetical protein